MIKITQWGSKIFRARTLTPTLKSQDQTLFPLQVAVPDIIVQGCSYKFHKWETLDKTDRRLWAMPPALKLLWNKSLSCIWVIPLTFHYTHTVRQGRDTSKFGVFLSPGVYRHKEVQDLTASPSVSLKSCLIISVCFRVNVASREISRHGLIATIQIGN